MTPMNIHGFSTFSGSFSFPSYLPPVIVESLVISVIYPGVGDNSLLALHITVS